MTRAMTLAVCVCCAVANADDKPSDFPSVVPLGTDVQLLLTGTATRSAFKTNLYRVASYCEDHPEVCDAASLLAADVPKQLRFKILGKVTGRLLTAGLTRSFRENDPDQQHAEECRKLIAFLKQQNLKPGDEIQLSLTPDEVLTCQVNQNVTCTFQKEGFGTIVWSVYFGERNISGSIRSALTAGLAKTDPASK